MRCDKYISQNSFSTSSNSPEGPYTDITQEVPMIGTLKIQLIKLLVQCMSRPEEVMLMENDDGEIVRVETQDTDGIALYKTMKEILVLLASVDYEITEAIFMSSLDDQVGSNFCGYFEDAEKCGQSFPRQFAASHLVHRKCEWSDE